MTAVNVAVEIAVASAAGGRAAVASGADRVELCSALELGGLTPSQGLVEAVLAETPEVHALVRPRAGDFVYDADELATAEREVRALLAVGVRGVVVGALTDAGTVDLEALQRLAGPAREAGATVTFHRALDVATSALRAFEEVLASGLVDRVLTSGGAAAAGEGVSTIGRMVGLADGRLQVMAGGGVTLEALPALVAAGVDAVHLSAKRWVPGRGGVALGTDDRGGHWVTEPQVVAGAVAAVGGR